MAGSFTTGGDVKAGALAQSGFSSVYSSEVYPLGTRRTQMADEVESGKTGTIDKGTGNSGVDRDVNFALLAGDREWVFIKCVSTAIKVGDVVIRNSATPFTGQPCAANAKTKPALLGVADNAIAVGEYGWVITKGCAVVRTDTS